MQARQGNVVPAYGVIHIVYLRRERFSVVSVRSNEQEHNSYDGFCRPFIHNYIITGFCLCAKHGNTNAVCHHNTFCHADTGSYKSANCCPKKETKKEKVSN